MHARHTTLLCAVLLLAPWGCSGSQSAPATGAGSVNVPTAPDGRPTITVKATDAGIPIDPRLFGTNIPAWVNPSQLGNPNVRAVTKTLGTTVVRLPGGSWSNHYDWLACEMGDSNGCHWTWASKPTDFLNFMRATGTQGMWTVSFNGTAKEAAAVVAFFNGAVGDTTRIGVDVRGKDWKRVGDWAALRAKNGNPAPYPIKLWEVGNEIYGAKQSTGGSNCASWGWEEVWTCDGNDYMLGKGTGVARHEGYLEFRAAMRAVDPTILVGAVSVARPGDWSDWGNKVIEKGGANLDFYVIHSYAVDKTPSGAPAVLGAAQTMMRDVVQNTNAAFDRAGARRRVPIAFTEYNLAAFQDLDNGQLMTRAVNALFIADVIGQMAKGGVAMANQWNLANGRAGNGTDYGLIDGGSATRAPQYYALKLWTLMGPTLLPVDSPLSDETTLSTYASKSPDGTISVLAINKTNAAVNARVALAGATSALHVTADVLAADNLEATTMQLNGNVMPANDLANAPAKALGDATGFLDHSFAPFSITVLRFRP